MKSTDVALIILIAAVSVIVSYFVGNAILGDPSDKVESLTYVRSIDSNVVMPDVAVFHPYSINPTQEVEVGRCEVGQAYDRETHECRNFSLKDITTNPDIPKPNPEPEPEPEPDPDNPDNPINPED